MSAKFNLGDRVRAYHNVDEVYRKGTVVEILSPRSGSYLVYVDEARTVQSYHSDELEIFVQPEVRIITTRRELEGLKVSLKIEDDWHEPDSRDITAEVRGRGFNNAGLWHEDTDGNDYQELHVILKQDGEPIARVNLATLFAWATGFEA